MYFFERLQERDGVCLCYRGMGCVLFDRLSRGERE